MASELAMICQDFIKREEPQRCRSPAILRLFVMVDEDVWGFLDHRRQPRDPLVSSAPAEQDMRYVLSCKVSAPSSLLLRFLRLQSDELCFFNTNLRANVCRCSSFRTDNPSFRCFSTPRRLFSTSPRPQATVQASFFSLDCLRSTSRNTSYKHAPPLQDGSYAGLLVPSESRDRPFSSRYASTNSRPILEKILGRRKIDLAPQPNESPPLPSFLDDVNGASLGRSKAARVNELKLRCTEFNEDGKVTLVNGEFKKTELIAKV